MRLQPFIPADTEPLYAALTNLGVGCIPIYMAQIFSPAANTIFRILLVGFPLAAIGGLFAAYRIAYSPTGTRVGYPIDQPVAFSHQHHAGELGIDCRYCHTTVEKAAFAGMPPTETCMTCHSQVWTEAGLLEVVRQSLMQVRPIDWTRVHNVADYVYFDHSIHINKGVGCASCHGRVDEMPITWKNATLQMGWCIECHRHPENALRPRNEIFNLAWKPSGEQAALGRELAKQYHIRSEQELTDCTTCHR